MKRLISTGLLAFSLMAQAQDKPITKTPETKKATDQEITAAVTDQLFFDRYFSPELVKVSAAEGVVTLTGTVDSLRAQDRAVTIAESIRGVRSVVNRLKIKAVTKKDSALKNDVVNALLLDPATDSYKVNVSVKDGIVTLDGTVGSWPEKNLASWVSRGVPGVLGTENQIKVNYVTERTDADIAQDVTGRLRKDPYLENSAINVVVQEGVVSYTGFVGSNAIKRRAELLGWVNGVKGIMTEKLSVDPWLKDDMKRNPASSRSDDEIRKSLKDAFTADPRVFSFNPSIEVSGGVVTLKGSVDNLAAKLAAEQDAMNTLGVIKVNNQLSVDPIFKKSDAEIKEAVRNQLSLNLKEDQRKGLEVMVKEGEVTIDGNTESPYVRNVAYHAAARVNGVKSVESNISVKNEQELKADNKLKKRIENRIAWSPVIDITNDKVNVQVDDGTAKITGEVDSWDEHFAATREAFKAGAREVENDLKIGKMKTNTFYDSSTYPFVYETYWVAPAEG